MAVLKQLPEKEIILGLKGVVDFACWKGVFYARKWPAYTGYNKLPGPAANQPAYGYISQQAKAITPTVLAAYQALADATQRTFRDYQIGNFYGYNVALELAPPTTVAFDPTAFDNTAFY